MENEDYMLDNHYRLLMYWTECVGLEEEDAVREVERTYDAPLRALTKSSRGPVGHRTVDGELYHA